MTYCNAMFETEEEKLRFVLESEERFRAGVHAVAERILAARPRIVTLSGPTCSGKTTTARILIARLAERGFRVRVISIDDFYRNRDELAEIARQKGVAYDWDSFASIDSAELKQFIDGVLAGRTVRCPKYDFLRKERCGFETVEAGEYDAVVFEGIQAIYPQVTAMFGEEPVCSVYISVGDDITACGMEFSSREIRFLRRLVRDYRFRGTLPAQTFDVWHTVVENERKNIEPYAGYAEMRIDSTLQYELFVIADEAVSLLTQVTPESGSYAEARNLIFRLSALPRLERRLVPADSVFREFIGAE